MARYTGPSTSSSFNEAIFRDDKAFEKEITLLDNTDG
jgi:hypothetical protein